MSDNKKALVNIIDASTCIILDIEGTTTSLDFVRKDLFSYRDQHLKNYVKEHWEESEVQDVVKELIEQENNDSNSSEHTNLNQEAIIDHLQHQIQEGKSSSAIKVLEGLIFKNGFINCNLKGHVYPDVPNALCQWKSQNKKIFIYSNGSIDGQRLLFKNTVHGNLENYIDGNFDTTIGSKLEATSYSKICEVIGNSPAETVFFSDNPKELLAAKQSGINIALVLRNPENPFFVQDENSLIPSNQTINSFSDVLS